MRARPTQDEQYKASQSPDSVLSDSVPCPLQAPLPSTHYHTFTTCSGAYSGLLPGSGAYSGHKLLPYSGAYSRAYSEQLAGSGAYTQCSGYQTLQCSGSLLLVGGGGDM